MTDGITLVPGHGQAFEPVGGHEHYRAELGEVLTAGQAPGGQPPTPEVVAAVRARHDIHQITPLTTRQHHDRTSWGPG